MRHILSSRHSIQPAGDGYSGAAASHRSHSQSSRSAAALSIGISISIRLAFKTSETGKMTSRAAGSGTKWTICRCKFCGWFSGLCAEAIKSKSISFQVGGAEILPYGPVQSVVPPVGWDGAVKRVDYVLRQRSAQVCRHIKISPVCVKER